MSSGEDDKGPIDEGSWLFEQLRRLAQDLTYPLITSLQLECTRDTCPEMKAGEWLYLCVAHGNNVGGHVQCCAIDYIVHTLDSATALLNSTRVFPSRLSVPQSSYRHFSSLARRLSRIFAHAFYHHRELFSQAEAESSLYARFLALSQQHSLVPPELLVIPLEGLESNHPNDRANSLGEHGPGSPQGVTEPDEEGTFLPNASNERAASQLRQLFDHKPTDEDVHDTNDEDIEDPELPEDTPLENSAAEGQESFSGPPEADPESTGDAREDVGSEEEHVAHVQGTNLSEHSAESLIQNGATETESLSGPVKEGAKPTPEHSDDPRPSSPAENGIKPEDADEEGSEQHKQKLEQHKEA